MMNKNKLTKVKVALELVKELFDKGNYKNVTFFKGVIITILVLTTISLFSTIYFTAKIFNFVTGRVLNHTEMVNSKIHNVHEAFDHAGHKLIDEYWDESLVIDELYKEEKKKEKIAEFDVKRQNIELAIEKLLNTSYQELEERGAITKQLNYLKSCEIGIDQWIAKRKGLVELKRRVAEKHKEDLKNGHYEGNGGKRGKEEYILEAAKFDPDTSYDNLFNSLKSKSSNDLALTDMYLDEVDFDQLKLCINSSAGLSKSIYDAIYVTDTIGNSKGKFIILNEISKNLLEQNLDFTIPLILTDETTQLRDIAPFPPLRDIYSTILEERGHFLDFHRKAMMIFEATNQKLLEINPNNMGFKTNAYKYRMQQYEYWKTYWDNLSEKANNRSKK